MNDWLARVQTFIMPPFANRPRASTSMMLPLSAFTSAPMDDQPIGSLMLLLSSGKLVPCIRIALDRPGGIPEAGGLLLQAGPWAKDSTPGEIVTAGDPAIANRVLGLAGIELEFDTDREGNPHREDVPFGALRVRPEGAVIVGHVPGVRLRRVEIDASGWTELRQAYEPEMAAFTTRWAAVVRLGGDRELRFAVDATRAA